MLRKKLEEIEVFNSSNPQDKYKKPKCFYCKQTGHVIKSCPILIKDEAEYAQRHPNDKERINPTQSKIFQDKNMVLCFKCKEYGHITDRCPSKEEQSKVSLKYPESIHFKTDGILKGTDHGTWDDLCYLSNTSDKHLCSNLNAFCNIKENFLVKELEEQKKFLFTYGMGEVIIKNDCQAYLIPGVYFAPEITLNILSINLLKQQGFEVLFEEERYRLEYMFKESTGNNLDLNRLRQKQNQYLDDYFERLDESQNRKKEEMVSFEEDINLSEVHTFHEFVAFLNLIKNDDIISKGWDIYRERFDKVLKWFYNHYLKRQLPGIIPPIVHGVPIHLFDLYKLIDCMGGYLSVQFGQEFGAIAEILGLTRNDGEEIKKCYMTYLDVFTSYYKTARAPEVPTNVEEDSESLVSYQWNIGKTCAPIAVQKGKEKLEHFGIKLEEETFCKEQQSAYYGKDQDKYTTYKGPSTSRISDKEDSFNSTSDDYIII
ncbi:ARID DNA-binding domain-containing protein [Tanacetum coccineum]|uniref:ARID DNA-binding domain-containing protein n=1 Tax=Tanacetum coccineum TaxID=301880 RepID=A0ABQ4XS13_9ASTR